MIPSLSIAPSARGRSRMSNRPSNAHSRVHRASPEVPFASTRAASAPPPPWREARGRIPGDVGSAGDFSLPGAWRDSSFARLRAALAAAAFAAASPADAAAAAMGSFGFGPSPSPPPPLRSTPPARALPVENARTVSTASGLGSRSAAGPGRIPPRAARRRRRMDAACASVERSRRNLRVAGWNPIRRRRRISMVRRSPRVPRCVPPGRRRTRKGRSSSPRRTRVVGQPPYRTRQRLPPRCRTNRYTGICVRRVVRCAPPTGPSGASSRREICSSPWRIPCSAGAEIRRAPPSPRGPAPRVPGGNRPCRSWWWPRPRDT